METRGFDIERYWQDIASQDRKALAAWFWESARINWHCTNESFSVQEFLQANCEYPGEWVCQVERAEKLGDTLVTATHVYARDKSLSCHAVSFFKMQDGKILQLDEYWGDDGPPPLWRQEMRIGRGL